VIDAWKNWENGAILEASSVPAGKIRVFAVEKLYNFGIDKTIEDFLRDTDDWFTIMFKNTDL
jgi:hypothetical protein